MNVGLTVVSPSYENVWAASLAQAEEDREAQTTINTTTTIKM